MGGSWRSWRREGGEGGGGEGGRENSSSSAAGVKEEEEEEEERRKGNDSGPIEAPKEEVAVEGGSSSSSLSSFLLAPLPPSSRPTRFRLEKRVNSCTLVLRDEQPVLAVEYRCLLETMLKEKGRKTGYCFVKEKRHKVG